MAKQCFFLSDNCSVCFNRRLHLRFMEKKMTPYGLVDLDDRKLRTPRTSFGPGPKIANPLFISTGIPLGCMLPLLYLLDTNDCCCSDPGVKLLIFAGSWQVLSATMINDIYCIGLIYILSWCTHGKMEINDKVVNMIGSTWV